MRIHLLSILLALSVGLIVFMMHGLVEHRLSSGAQASVLMSPEMDDVAKGRDLSSREKSRLRRNVSAHPETLLDMAGHDVYAVFKAPEMVRRDAPTTVWQYRTAACVLDIYFVTERKEAFAAPVAYYEVRTRQGPQSSEHRSEDKDACLQDVLDESGKIQMVSVNTFFKAQ